MTPILSMLHEQKLNIMGSLLGMKLLISWFMSLVGNAEDCVESSIWKHFQGVSAGLWLSSNFIKYLQAKLYL